MISTVYPPVDREPRNTPITVDFVKSTARTDSFAGFAFQTAPSSEALCRTTSRAFSTLLYWPRSSVVTRTGWPRTAAAHTTAAAARHVRVDTGWPFDIQEAARPASCLHHSMLAGPHPRSLRLDSLHSLAAAAGASIVRQTRTEGDWPCPPESPSNG